ncbi:MAG: dephospho-CoA kinase, partial [Clostridia bacterium]|nr:dephospho-CoA kinase [Clostridia bacterium]
MKQKPEIYGLTGGSGSGKSSAADILKEKGFFVIDADITAREILNGDVLEKLRINFGNSVINSDGTLNRKALAKIVFADNDKLSLLNSITHPEI